MVSAFYFAAHSSFISLWSENDNFSRYSILNLLTYVNICVSGLVFQSWFSLFLKPFKSFVFCDHLYWMSVWSPALGTRKTWCQLSNGIAKVIASWLYTRKDQGWCAQLAPGKPNGVKILVTLNSLNWLGTGYQMLEKICVLSEDCG